MNFVCDEVNVMTGAHGRQEDTTLKKRGKAKGGGETWEGEIGRQE